MIKHIFFTLTLSILSSTIHGAESMLTQALNSEQAKYYNKNGKETLYNDLVATATKHKAMIQGFSFKIKDNKLVPSNNEYIDNYRLFSIDRFGSTQLFNKRITGLHNETVHQHANNIAFQKEPCTKPDMHTLYLVIIQRTLEWIKIPDNQEQIIAIIKDYQNNKHYHHLFVDRSSDNKTNLIASVLFSFLVYNLAHSEDITKKINSANLNEQANPKSKSTGNSPLFNTTNYRLFSITLVCVCIIFSVYYCRK